MSDDTDTRVEEGQFEQERQYGTLLEQYIDEWRDAASKVNIFNFITPDNLDNKSTNSALTSGQNSLQNGDEKQSSGNAQSQHVKGIIHAMLRKKQIKMHKYQVNINGLKDKLIIAKSKGDAEEAGEIQNVIDSKVKKLEKLREEYEATKKDMGY